MYLHADLPAPEGPINRIFSVGSESSEDMVKTIQGMYENKRLNTQLMQTTYVKGIIKTMW